ncbi:MAG: 3-isopropylmalate dehydratase large subunit [Alphaproteobacteria bacterium]|nr:3-isopropylmalate dehydratase large subunit [Alphaproteobacteria bacterium]
MRDAAARRPTTLAEQIWARHEIRRSDRGESLLYVDRHFLDETCFFCFEDLERRGLAVRRPELTLAVADHTVSTIDRLAQPADAEIRAALDWVRTVPPALGIPTLAADDQRQGIIHVVAPEAGIVLPGLIVACSDSHTTTHGAFGALGLGIGMSESTHILATQTLWQRPYRQMRITVAGRLGFGVVAKDVIMAVVARIGAEGAAGHIVEFAGDAVTGLSMEGRMTLCNMSIECGARAGLIAPDDTTFSWLEGREQAPHGAAFTRAVAAWSTLRSHADAVFDRDVSLDAAAIAPMVSWGTSPEDADVVTEAVPDPAMAPSATRRNRMERALAYMGLTPGTPLDGIAVDRVFIGSCTNGRLEDLRAAASVVRGRRAVVPAIVVPGSRAVRRAAEAEGLDQVFRDAGLEWRDAGCSMCVAMNGDRVAPGERCASTSNRNFVGRQGQGARTHLMSPAMAAAAAISGRIIDVRRLPPAPAP